MRHPIDHPLRDARAMLLFGAAGERDLLRAADLASAQGLPGLARALRLDALESAPFSGEAAAAVVAAEREGASRDPRAAHARALLTAVQDADPDVQGVGYFQRLVERREGEKLLDFLEGRLARNAAPFWLHQAWHFGRFAAREGWLAAHVATHAAAGPVRDFVRAECAFGSGDHEAALSALAAFLQEGEMAGWQRPRLLAAESLRRLGRREEAVRLFAAVLGQRPWDAGLWRTLHDLALDVDRARAALPGSLAVCLYSWNKAEPLAGTLEALLPAVSGAHGSGAHGSGVHGAGDVLVVLLDNGSTDETPEVARAFADRMGERFASVRLPVNVGAAGARNWLSALPQVMARDFVCFLDDDALLPPDAFGLLGAAVATHPEAFVWGAKVVDAAAPQIVQHAGQHLLLDEEGFRVDNPQAREPDRGRLDMLAPCTTVTGCCHLFRAAELRAGGGFDIRLSPSQYDDLERDVRRGIQGGFAVCQGHLAVRHLKSSGAASRVERAAAANAAGNRLKLQALHPAAEVARLIAADLRRQEDDLAAKATRLAATLPELTPALKTLEALTALEEPWTR